MPKAKADVWTEGSGLFDLNNLKSGDKTLLEFKPQNSQKEEDKIWGGLASTNILGNQTANTFGG